MRPSTAPRSPTAAPAPRRGVLPPRSLPVLCALVCAVALSGCALSTMTPGTSIADARQRMGTPAVEHATADGGRRLLYPMGLQTHALEFDAQGRLLRSGNVLDEPGFARIEPGMTRQQVHDQLGPPSRVWGVRLRNQTVWSYSFDDVFCRQFHVGLSPAGIVEDTSFGPDPRCERPRFFPGGD